MFLVTDVYDCTTGRSFPSIRCNLITEVVTKGDKSNVSVGRYSLLDKNLRCKVLDTDDKVEEEYSLYDLCVLLRNDYALGREIMYRFEGVKYRGYHDRGRLTDIYINTVKDCEVNKFIKFKLIGWKVSIDGALEDVESSQVSEVFVIPEGVKTLAKEFYYNLEKRGGRNIKKIVLPDTALKMDIHEFYYRLGIHEIEVKNISSINTPISCALTGDIIHIVCRERCSIPSALFRRGYLKRDVIVETPSLKVYYDYKTGQCFRTKKQS